MLQLDLLKRTGALNERQQKVMGRIHGSATRATTLIESLLEYARLQQANFPLRIGAVDLGTLTAEVVEELGDQASAKNIELVLLPPGDVPAMHSDHDLMRLILTNLIGNAIKYTDQGRVEVAITHRDGNHVISVSDTGPGISLQHQDVMFEAFEQLEPIDGKHKHGFGLGLAITRKAAQALGGKIVVDSKIGVGSRFTAVLPRPVAAETL